MFLGRPPFKFKGQKIAQNEKQKLHLDTVINAVPMLTVLDTLNLVQSIGEFLNEWEYNLDER